MKPFHLILTLATLCLTFASSHAQTPPAALSAKTQLDIFLLAGQSNMAGRGIVEAADKVPNPRVWTFTKEQQWAPAIDPLHFDKPKLIGVGPGRAFGIAVAEAQPKIQVGLVPCAVGGTSIDQWKKGGALYNNALSRARAAMKHGQLKAILWHQGEADRAKADETGYWEKLRQLIADFRADLNAPKLPFIVGEIGRFKRRNVESESIAPFNKKLMSFAATIPYCAGVSSEGLTSLSDNLHFDAAGARELGRRYAAAYLNLLKNQPSPVANTATQTSHPTRSAAGE